VRLNIAVPEGHRYNANQLMRALLTAADEATFGEPGYQDAKGNRYSFASGPLPDGFGKALRGDLVEPDHNANMDAAKAAQAILRFEGPASPDAIVVIEGDDVMAALKALGLVAVEWSGL
jgi:hypothetical protein